jgi:hypothetical protein
VPEALLLIMGISLAVIVCLTFREVAKRIR